MSESTRCPSRSLRSATALLLVAAYALLVSTQFVTRYRGHWVEQDTVQLTEATRNVLQAARLMPAAKVYPHGFSYSAVLTFVSHTSGVALGELQTVIGPFALVLTGTCAFVLYRQLTGSVRLGVLATILLCMQPELVFVILRGSHERFTWAMVILIVFCLARGYTYVGRRSTFAILVFLNYLATLALISLNSFFASSFIIALTLSFAGGWIMVVRRLHDREWFDRDLRRLVYVVGSSAILIYLFIFYFYSPAAQLFELLNHSLDKLAALFLNFDPKSTIAPYDYVSIGWLNPQVYLALTIGTWAILFVSLVSWLRTAYRSFFRQQRPFLNHLLLWLLYGAFAAQIAISMILDRFNLLATNLQVRLFPAVMLFAIPLALMEVRELLTLVRLRRHVRWMLGAALVVLALYLSGASILKATLDPLVSNKWIYFSPAEDRAVTFIEERLQNVAVWVGYDERLRQLAYSHWGSNLPSGNNYNIFRIGPHTRHVLLSDLVRRQASRIRQSLPGVWLAHRIYDSGPAELYQFRPQTPYQR